MKKFKAGALELLGAVCLLGDWFSLAVTAGLVAVLVAIGIATHHIGAVEGLRNYAGAMLASTVVVWVSVGADELRRRLVRP